MSVSGGRKFRDRKDLQRQLTTNGLSKKEFEILDELPYLTLDDIRYCFNEGPIARAIHEGDPNGPPLALLKTIRNPDYFWFTCRHIFNIELLPFQAVILKELWNRPFPMLIMSRGGGKSMTLGLYALLRALLVQGSKIVLCGASFRQAKIIFEYCESIWYTAPLFKDILGSSCTPHHENDKQSFRIGRSMISALPLGDGNKIRGARATDLLVDEFHSIAVSVFENVLSGFAAVTSSPIQNVKQILREKLYQEFGLKNNDSNYIPPPNKSIIAGTPYYQFNHFYNYFIRWKSIVESKGDPKKLREIFKNNIPDGFDWRDYSVIRIPYDLIPEGFMDIKTIGKSKASGSVHNFLLEYAACVQGNTKVITNFGVKSIKLIKEGDKVLTHKGRFRKVVKTFKRVFFGKIINYKTYGYNRFISITPEHPLWLQNNNWEKADDYFALSKVTYLPNLQELNNNYEIDARNYTKDFMERGEFIFPLWSQSRLSNEEVKKIKNDPRPRAILAKEYNTSITAIQRIKTIKKIPKNAIKYKIKLDYDFGICIGYYASEGSCGAEGRCLSFALDGHIDKDLDYIKDTLITSLINIFNITPKEYRGQTNNINIAINSRVLVDIFKNICPGIAHTKYILPEILFSNPEFMKGFIVGYWNGDGHKSNIRTPCYSSSVSEKLSSQVRLCLSYFGISSSLMKKHDNSSLSNNRRPFYTIGITGCHARKFKNIFYNQNLDVELHYRWYMKNENNNTIFQVDTFNKSNYHGYVYNLEVEEDNSYCLLNGAVHNCFSRDSDGFYRRSLIESCVVNDTNKITTPAYGEIRFSAALRGQPGSVYVMGIDPASEQDNFSIIILEICKDHKRIVHCWTTNRKKFRDRFNENKVEDNDFYYYCARKIRELMEMFPCARIGLDLEGGGRAIREALGNTKALKEGELPIYEIIVEDKPKDTDNKHGLHILECVSFSSAEWVSTANHTLRMDFESKTLLFPFFDSASLEMAAIEDYSNKREYDTLEDCVLEIEELKDELSSIVISRTPNGNRDRWDTPEVKLPGGKKGKQRKDRYTSLLIANACCRSVQNQPAAITYERFGGFSKTLHQQISEGGAYYTGDEWINEHFRKNGGYY